MKLKPVIFNDENTTYSIYRIDFHSLTDLELFLAAGPSINKEIFPTQKSRVLTEDFAGAPLEDAIRYCHGGYEKDFDLFLKLKKELENTYRKPVKIRRSIPAVVGSRPHVPNFVAGTPKTMWRLDRVREKKFIDVYINLVYSGFTTEEQIRNRGILTLNLINLFEQNDIAVNLKAFEASYVKNEIFIADVSLKRPGQVLNVGKCYYPLCAKEFVRRVLLRVKESMPFKQKWGVGYGGGLPKELLQKVLNIGDNKILIRSPIEMGLKGKNIFEDADIFFEDLHLSDNIYIPNNKRISGHSGRG